MTWSTLFWGFFGFYLMLTCGTSCNLKSNQKSQQPQDPPGETRCETRGTWLWASSIDSENKRAVVLQKISNANLNTVFVSIPSINGNHGYGTADAFLEFIKEAKILELSIHGWMSNGRRKGRDVQADFRNPGEQDAQVQWVNDLMNLYGDYLDGVHLDYIRYIDGEAVNLDKKMDGVTETVRKIANHLKTNFPGKFLTAAVFREEPSREEVYRDPPLWVEDVPQWFREWYAAHPGSIYHGSGWVYVPMHMKYQQNPVGWLKEEIMDAVMPMKYTIHDDEWNQTADYFKSFNTFVGNEPTATCMGIGWLPKTSDSSNRGFDPPGVVRKIRYGRSIGMNGFVIFILANHETDDSALIDALVVDSGTNDNNAPFKEWVPSCLK